MPVDQLKTKLEGGMKALGFPKAVVNIAKDENDETVEKAIIEINFPFKSEANTKLVEKKVKQGSVATLKSIGLHKQQTKIDTKKHG